MRVAASRTFYVGVAADKDGAGSDVHFSHESVPASPCDPTQSFRTPWGGPAAYNADRGYSEYYRRCGYCAGAVRKWRTRDRLPGLHGHVVMASFRCNHGIHGAGSCWVPTANHKSA